VLHLGHGYAFTRLYHFVVEFQCNYFGVHCHGHGKIGAWV